MLAKRAHYTSAQAFLSLNWIALLHISEWKGKKRGKLLGIIFPFRRSGNAQHDDESNNEWLSQQAYCIKCIRDEMGKSMAIDEQWSSIGARINWFNFDITSFSKRRGRFTSCVTLIEMWGVEVEWAELKIGRNIGRWAWMSALDNHEGQHWWAAWSCNSMKEVLDLTHVCFPK